MKISALISRLEEIKTKFGDIAITGGMMQADQPLKRVSVTDTHGYEVWPIHYYPEQDFPVDGVLFE